MEQKVNIKQKIILSLAFFWVIFGLVFLIWGILNRILTNSSYNQPEVTVSISPTPSTPDIIGEEKLVIRVVDGDTIEVEGNQKIRYIGIDTPETVDPRRPVACFGKEASDENKKLVEGKKVILEKDISETDKYERLLRYVYVKNPDGTTLFVNDYLVRQGFAKISTYPPDVKFTDQFLAAQVEARENQKGLWQKCL
ncbi:MAG: thermonuclease family protein [Candidatus Daviesbacteria bacterium]